MLEPRLVPALGTWVQDDRFWGRELELELFETGLEEGNNYLLVAQRRMGKTSLMRETARQRTWRFKVTPQATGSSATK